MLVSENGKMHELPDDIRAFDEYKMYGNILVVHYVSKKNYSVYYQTDNGLDLKESKIEAEPRFYEPNFFFFFTSEDDNVLYNTTNGIVIARGDFNTNFDIYEGNRFKAIILKFYEGGIKKYRVFDDKGNEILDVGKGKKVEILNYRNMGNIMILRIRNDICYFGFNGILHIIFNEDGTSEVIKVIPPSYDRIELNLYAAVKDDRGKIHYPTYTAIKYEKEIRFTFAGEKIRLPEIS